jgi:rubrerythrin
MPSHQLILPRADAGCGKVFYEERRAADEHRIALEFWNQATGHVRKGYHLAVYRCKRCGGFHIGQKRIEKPSCLLRTIQGGKDPASGC